MGTIYRLTLRQLSGRWRLTIMAVLATLPVIIALLMVSQGNSPSVVEFEVSVLSAMLAGSITPLMVLAIAAVGFANELEDRTLANLTLSSVPRWRANQRVESDSLRRRFAPPPLAAHAQR